MCGASSLCITNKPEQSLSKSDMVKVDCACKWQGQIQIQIGRNRPTETNLLNHNSMVWEPVSWRLL